jgi:hypothetical protein
LITAEKSIFIVAPKIAWTAAQGKSAPTACSPTHEVVDPPSEFTPASGTPRRERGGNSVAKGGMSGDLARCANPATSGRCSVRNFGEYAFLEDSRYASQAKNAGDAKTVARAFEYRQIYRAASTFS